MTTPSERNQDARPGDDVGYPLLLTKDDAGLTGFPAALLPGNRVLVRDLPADRVGGISAGEVSLIPPPGSDLPVRRARPTGSFVHRTSDDAPTVNAIVTLDSPVADVRIPGHLTDEKHFEDLLSRHDGDLHAGLVAEGMSARPLGAEQPPARASQKLAFTPPEITVDHKLGWSLCSWLGIFC